MNDLELGNQHYINKEYDVAKECYDRILEIDPNNLTVWHNRGLACTQMGLNEEAIESFKLPCSYNSAESILSRGVVKRNMGLYKEAMEDFRSAKEEIEKKKASAKEKIQKLKQ